MTPESSSAELLKFAIQAAIVGVGWWVVNRMAISRERDKSRREMITKNVDSLTDFADKIFEMGRDYHFSVERDQKNEIKLKIALQDFSYRVGRLELLTGDPTSIAQHRESVVRFRRSITEHHFEDEFFGPLDTSSPVSQDMASSVISMKQCLQDLKHLQFPAPSPSWVSKLGNLFAN